ncbi:MAG: hypothetical protein ACR65R_14220 [Methylomicrobium sp.]
MQEWNLYKEIMLHEMDELENEINLSISGYKLDKEGIKKFINCNQYKSVDYIADDELLSLVEFSDIYRQQNKIVDQIEDLTNSNADRDLTIEPIIKKLKASIRNELVQKFNDTISIVQQMLHINYCSELSDRYSSNHNLKRYLIIIAPFHHAIPTHRRVHLARLINQEEKNISSSLPKVINVQVKIVSLENFAES